MQMKEKGMKHIKRLLKGIVLAICIFAILAAGISVLLMTHTQIIVGTIQKAAQDVVNTKNSYEPLHEPMQTKKNNEQYIITELNYSEEYPNSYLDITYPDEHVETERPTLVYFHGGGFFCGSKCDGDPLAEGDATALLDDICDEGFNLVNIDYALVPEYHFPTPLIQANQAFGYLMEHAEEYHLDMNRIVIMGSSAGAIITSQIGSIITNPDYADTIGIQPVLKAEQVKAVVLDDAPLVYNRFSIAAKVLVGNYVKGSILLNDKEIRAYNNILWVNADYPAAFLLGSEYYADMREMDAALTNAGVVHELVDPLAERGLVKQHCFVAAERTDEVAKDAFDRMIAFIKEKVE